MATAPVYQAVSEKSIADRFLADIGAPATPEMERAIIAWMRAESGTGTVTANNPWNLTGSGWANIVGFWHGGSATEQHDFPVFYRWQDGVDAAAKNLLSPGNGYPTAVQQARAGNATGFLNALAASNWCSCHYQYGGPGSPNLLSIFDNVGTLGTVATRAPGNYSSAGIVLASAPSADQIKAALNYILKTIPGSTIMSQSMGQVAIPDSFSGCPKGFTAEAYPTLGNPAGTHVCFLTDLASLPGGAQVEGAAAAVGDWATVAADILDPKHWAHGLAVAGGAALIVWGGIMVWQASS